MKAKGTIVCKGLLNEADLKEVWEDVPKDVLEEFNKAASWGEFYGKPIVFFNTVPYRKDAKIELYKFLFVAPIVELGLTDKWSEYSMHLTKYMELTRRGVSDVDVSKLRTAGEEFTKEKNATENRIQNLRASEPNPLQDAYNDFKRKKKLQVHLQMVDVIILGKETRQFLMREENENILHVIGDNPLILDVVTQVAEDIYQKKTEGLSLE